MNAPRAMVCLRLRWVLANQETKKIFVHFISGQRLRNWEVTGVLQFLKIFFQLKLLQNSLNDFHRTFQILTRNFSKFGYCVKMARIYWSRQNIMCNIFSTDSMHLMEEAKANCGISQAQVRSENGTQNFSSLLHLLALLSESFSYQHQN